MAGLRWLHLTLFAYFINPLYFSLFLCSPFGNKQRNRLKRQKNGSNKLFEPLGSAGYSALNQSREEKEVHQKRVEKVQRSLRWHRPLLVSLRKYNATCTDIRSLYKLCSQRHASVRSTKQ